MNRRQERDEQGIGKAEKRIHVPCAFSDASNTAVTSELSGIPSIHLWVTLLTVYVVTKDASLSCVGSLHLYL